MSDETALIELSTLHHRLVTPPLVARCGISAARWRRMQDDGRWIEVAPDHFRHAATPMTFELSVRAGAGWLGRRGALFGGSALRWLGVDVAEPARAEFLVPRHLRSTTDRIAVHTTTRWDPKDIVRHDGVRTCVAARALVDFASVTSSARRVEAAIDDAIRARRTALPQIVRRLNGLSGKGRHGTPLLRELLLDSGGESFLERRFLRLVRTAGLPRPACQVVFRRGSTTAARVDFLFGTTVVEVSGRLGHVSDRERQKDARRRNQLQQSGLVVLEFTTADVIDDSDHVVATLRRQLA